MPRIRSIHPDICDDEVVAGLSAYAFRTWVLLWTHLDDKGRGPDNPKLWKGKLYPLADDVTSERVLRDLDELTACGLLIRYEADGRRWLSTKPETWGKYQKPQHPTPSKIPDPPAVSRSPHEDSGSLTPEGLGVGAGDNPPESSMGPPAGGLTLIEGRSEADEPRLPTRPPAEIRAALRGGRS